MQFPDTAVLLFLTFYLLCLGFFVNIMELFATVIQVSGLDSSKNRFNPPFYTKENNCTKSGI